MQYSNIRSRAGLVALLFALIISLVSAVPIPATESGLSSTLSLHPTLDGHHHIKVNSTTKISTPPDATRAPTSKHDSTNLDMDDQLVRRSVGSKIKHAFQKAGQAIKKGFQKAGSAIKHVAQNVGHAVKTVAKNVGHAVKTVAKKVGHTVKSVAKKVGHTVKSVAKKVGHAVKSVAKKVGHTVKSVAKKVGHGIVRAAKKVGHFMKTTGAKVAKFGFKVVESVGTVIGKVANFIPGIGKPIDRAIEGVSKVAGVISDHIHAKLSNKLQKGMNVMNKADKVMGYIPRRRELSEEEAFQQRDISDAYYFEERDDIALEDREESYFEAYERDIYERDIYEEDIYERDIYEEDIYERYDLDEE